MNRLALACCALLIAPAARAAEDFLLKDDRRIVFLGDSITHAGLYIQYLDAYLVTRFPDRRFELINLGLSSETASGLSEPEHPFPRPDVHERLGRALEVTKPDVVVACYGMNDGIYYPFDEGRFAKYREGIRRLIDRVREAKAEVVLVTPPPFDALPVRSNLRPAGAERYSYAAPFSGYDETLTRDTEWLLSLRKEGLRVADAHGDMTRFVESARVSSPQYTLARDGIHPDATGHWLIARAILQAWGAPATVDEAVIDVKERKSKAGRVGDLKVEGEGVRFSWTTRVPMPLDPKWDRTMRVAEDVADHFDRRRLTVIGLPGARNELSEGDRRLGVVDRDRLARGVDLLAFPELTTNRRAAELLPLIAKRQHLLGPAWLSAVGHKRPGVQNGPPLEEAKRQAAGLDAQIRELAQPVALDLALTSIEP